jgi:hypothetical protein
MEERRSFLRRPAGYEVEYTVTEVTGGHASAFEAKGMIIDLSDGGFGLETGYPLHKGHVITIRRGEGDNIPSHGLVLWSKRVNGKFRAGLRHFPR